jgi:DNA polymerase
MRWVDGVGPADAAGFVVGEAPGAQELEQGVPFVGPAGQVLDNALMQLGVQRDRLYITNVVKAFPCDSDGRPRTPNGEEIRSWAPDLFSEVQRFAGVPMLALGKVASVALTSRWTPGRCARATVHVAWHPAYVMRRRSYWNDWLGQLAPWARAVVEFEKKMGVQMQLAAGVQT